MKEKFTSTIERSKFFSIAFAVMIAGMFFTTDVKAQIAFRNAQSATTSSTTLTINKPTNLAVGDLMIANILQNGNDFNNFVDAVGNGASWTQIAGTNLLTSGNDRWRSTILYRVATAADVAATSFDFDLDAQSDDGAGGILAFSGVAVTGGVSSGPFDVTPGNALTNIANDGTFTATAVTTVTANAMIVMLGAAANDLAFSNWVATNPATLTEAVEQLLNSNLLDAGVGAAYGTRTGTGSTGTASATISASTTNGALLVALRPCTANPTITTASTPQAAAAVCFSGSSQTTTLAYTATTNSPTAYSIDWNAAANTAGLTDQTSTAFAFAGGGGSVTGITIPASVAAGTYSGTMYITTAGGCITSKTITLTVNSTPTVNAGGALSAICQGGTSAALGGSVGGSATGGTWSDGGVGGTFNSGATVLNTTWTPPGGYTGTAVLTLTTSGGSCGTTFATKNQVVNAPPTTAAAGGDLTICQVATTLAANAASAGTGAWTIPSGPNTSAAQLNSTSNPTATFTPTAAGTYTLRWTISNSPCAASFDEVVYTVNALPQVSAFSGNTICNGDIGTLTGTLTGSSPYTITYNPGAIVESGVTSGTPFNVTPNPGSPGTTNYTITSIQDANGCTRTSGFTDASASITVNADLSAAGITPTGAQTFCASGSGAVLTASATGGGTVTRQWGKRSVSGGTITPLGGQTASTYTPTGASLGTGSWLVVCTTTPTCGSPIISNEVSVTVNANLSAVNISPTGSQTFCVSGSGSLLTAAETGGTTFTRQWGRRSVSGGTITAIGGQTGATYTPTGASLTTGNWFVVCTSTPATGCGSAVVSNEVAVVVNALPQVSAFTGNSICSGNIGQLTVTTSAGTAPFIVTYNPGGVSESGITSGSPFNATPNPTSTSNYTITLIEDANGCQRNASFTDATAIINVSNPLTSISYSANPVVYCPGIAISNNTPVVTGGTATAYSVSPALPTGLTLNTGTGVISGTPTVAVAAANYTVTASNACGNVTVNVNIATDVPALTTTPGARCGTGTVALSATKNTNCITSTINWFSVATGGSSLGTGLNFTTPSISSTANYFAEESFTSAETSIGTGNSTTNNRGLAFTLYEPIVLRSVQVQSNSGTANLTFALQDNTGATVPGVSNVTTSVGTGVNTITLNWTIPAGSYRILYSSGGSSLRRTDTYTFPKTIGVGLITSSIEAGVVNTTRYQYFYNWVIARVRVSATATVNPVPTITPGATPSISRGSGSANLAYSGTSGAPDEYSIDFNATAEGAGFNDVTAASLPASPITLTVPVAADAATYSGTLTVRNSSTGCISSSNAISVTINKTPLTVTAEDKNKTFDGNVFTGFTSSISGFINGENSGVVTGTVTYTGAATTATAIGTYTITPVVAGLSATNYTFVPADGTLSIDPISQSNADFRSKTNGNFSAAGTWEYDLGGGNWQNATQAPTSSNNVSITHDVVLDQNYTVGVSKNFSLGTGATFVVNPTRTFAVATGGAVDFGNKSVTLQSDNTGTAAIGQILGTITGATNVTVERYVPNNGFRSWRLLSVPTFGNGQTIRQAWQEGDANPLPMQNNLTNRGTQITGVFSSQAAAASAGFDSTSVQASMLTWNGTNWSNVTNTNTPIANNQAYFLYIRGERSKGVSGAINNTSATTLRTNGTIYSGDQVTNVGANSFALVPNLYPSPITFAGVTRTGGVSNLFYVWDSKKQNGTSLGIYQTFSGTNGFNCMISGGSYVLGQPNTIIESGQAFFVQSAAAGTVTLKETSKTNNAGGQLGFRPTTPASALVKIDTRLYGPGANNMLDANVVVFDAAYSNAVDGDDAVKFNNPGENIGIQKGTSVLAIEGRQPVADNDAIVFKMWNMQQQTYRFEFVAGNMATQGVYAVLEDAYLNANTTLDLSGTTIVNFTVNADAASKAANRFRIVFRQLAPVPVNFVSITGHRVNTGVKVEWKSASERGIKTYVVERSDDGRNFKAVGSTEPASNNAIEISYSFDDITAPSTAVMYRIKSQGVNNEIRYSPVAKVSAASIKAGFVISPNPVENGIVNLQFNAQQTGKYSIRIISTEGKTIMLKSVAHAGGNSTQTVTLPATTARGTYTVEIIAPDRTKTIQTLFVNKK